MIGQRLQQMRLARGLSLEGLAAKMGGIVSKQALSKYERELANPSPVVLTRLASALGVHASYFFKAPSMRVEFIAYRSAILSNRESMQLRSRIQHDIEARVSVLNLLGKADGSQIPVGAFPVNSPDDAEKAADALRSKWQLGMEPILNLTDTLENNSVCVFDIEAGDNFDGISAKVFDDENRLQTVALVTRFNVDEVRQRLNLAHELGHVVMRVNRSLDDETAAFRFGAAFLAPARRVYEEIGQKRTAIQLEELMMLKKRFGLSAQSLARRLCQLEIINESYYSEWRSFFAKLGWTRHEPEDWPHESSEWMEKQVRRLVAEGSIGADEARSLLGDKIDAEKPESLIRRTEFLKLPIEKRREILAQEAIALAKHYAEPEPTLAPIGEGDIIDY